MASTHCASTKSDLLMLADSVILSLPLPVLRLSSEPARSMAHAVLTLVSEGVAMVTLTHRMACDRDECALSFVAPVLRLELALSYSTSKSFSEPQGSSVRPTTTVFPPSASRIG